MPLLVEVDWDRSGNLTDDFTDEYEDDFGSATPGEDVTDWVRPRIDALSFSYGRDQSTALAPTVSGSGGFTLDNSDRRFSPRNTASPLCGYLKPARPVRITRKVGAITNTLFTGHTDDSPINPDVDSKTVSLSLVDSLADFRDQTIGTALHRGIRTGQAIGYILDACGWPEDKRDLDVGATIIPWWWEDGDAFNALEKVVRSEGPPALLTVGPAGEIVFRDRHHRLSRAESLTSQQTWGQGLLTLNTPFSSDEAWRNIINSGVAEVEVRHPGQVEAVWTSEGSISVAAGQVRLITASGSDPFYDAIPPVAGVDFTAITGSVSVDLLRDSGSSATIRLTAVGGAAVISGLRLRARPVPVGHTEQVSVADDASKDDYGTRSFPGDLPWCSPDDAEAILSIAVGLRAQPISIVSARFMVGRNTAKAAVLGQDLGNRVTIVEAETVTNGPFYIESFQHELTGEHDHAVTFGLEAVPQQVDPVFRLDTAGQGADQGYLGNPFIDPENLLILDSNVAGHRADEAVAAA